MLKITCPNNKSHKKFITLAHVVQEWAVDQDGELLEVTNDCVQVTHSPDKDDLFQCDICEAEAKAELVLDR
jgi:hypothetical protein